MIELIESTKIKHSDGSYKSLYRCQCGATFLAVPGQVRAGKTVSCGCYRKSGGAKVSKGKTPVNALKDPSESSFNGLYHAYKNSAKIKCFEFSLSKEEFKILTKMLCHYCGTEPKSEHWQTKWARAPYVYNGLDRKDNTMGYSIGNILSCCAACNYLKRGNEYDSFLAHLFKIVDNLRPL